MLGTATTIDHNNYLKTRHFKPHFTPEFPPNSKDVSVEFYHDQWIQCVVPAVQTSLKCPSGSKRESFVMWKECNREREWERLIQKRLKCTDAVEKTWKKRKGIII